MCAVDTRIKVFFSLLEIEFMKKNNSIDLKGFCKKKLEKKKSQKIKCFLTKNLFLFFIEG